MQVEVAGRVAPARGTRRRAHLRTGILFMSPAFLVMIFFLLGPVIWAIYVSLTNMSLTGEGAATPQFIGLDNFVRILHDSAFYNALRVSLTYLVGSALIGQAVLGLLLALLMRQRNAIFKSVLGAIIVGAWIIPDVVAGFLWSAFYAGGPGSIVPPGLLNSIVSTFGLPQQAWLQDYPMAATRRSCARRRGAPARGCGRACATSRCRSLKAPSPPIWC